jgi:hypothetical protein
MDWAFSVGVWLWAAGAFRFLGENFQAVAFRVTLVILPKLLLDNVIRPVWYVWRSVAPLTNHAKPCRKRSRRRMCNFDVVALAPIFTATIAFFAAMVAFAALRLNRKYQRETIGKATFREFLRLAVQHPDLAEGKIDPSKQDEYAWFVAYFLWAAEEVLKYSRKEWEANLRLHMTYHKEYLKNDQRSRKEDFPTYNAALRKLIDDVVGSTSLTK